MARFVDKSHEGAESLALFVDGYTGYDPDQQLVRHTDPQLWTGYQLEPMVGQLFVQFKPDEVATARYHVMQVGVDLPVRFPL